MPPKMSKPQDKTNQIHEETRQHDREPTETTGGRTDLQGFQVLDLPYNLENNYVCYFKIHFLNVLKYVQRTRISRE